MMLRTVLSWQLHFKPFFVQRSVPLECGNKSSINIERTSVLEYGRAAIPRENTDEVLRTPIYQCSRADSRRKPNKLIYGPGFPTPPPTATIFHMSLMPSRHHRRVFPMISMATSTSPPRRSESVAFECDDVIRGVGTSGTERERTRPHRTARRGRWGGGREVLRMIERTQSGFPINHSELSPELVWAAPE